MRIIKWEDHKVSDWSGGKTREIFLYPEDGSYKERNFVFRVSSASVDLEESDFTMLDGVQRFLSLLKGAITLDFAGDMEKINMEPGDVLEFAGDLPVHCVGTCTDFNLMCKGAEGFMECPDGDVSDELGEDQQALYFAKEAVSLTVDGKQVNLSEGDSMLTEGEKNVACKEGEKLIVCVMNRK